MCGGEEKKSNLTRTPNPLFTQKVFEEKWTYRSGIIGLGVRLRLDLVFEVEWIFQA
jgi:hypothetical protein